jgi:hypothetical protein
VAANVVRYLEKLTFASAKEVQEARGTWGAIALTVRTGGCCRDGCRARWPLSGADTEQYARLKRPRPGKVKHV